MKIVKSWDAKTLGAKYSQQLGVNIERFIKSDRITLVEDENTGLQQFQGCDAGDAQFYSELSQHPWYYMSEKWEYRYAANYIGDRKNDTSILDVGCGSGAFLKRLKDSGFTQIAGLEFNDNALALCRSAGLDVQPKWMSQLIAEGNKFDLVCAFQVLEHVTQPQQFISEVAALLKDDGIAIISTPNRDSFMRRFTWEILDMPPHHMSRWNALAYSKVGATYGMMIERFGFEPLAPYHRSWFMTSFLQWMPEKAILRSTAARLLSLAIYLDVIRTRITGHTVLAVYRKSQAQAAAPA